MSANHQLHPNMPFDHIQIGSELSICENQFSFFYQLTDEKSLVSLPNQTSTSKLLRKNDLWKNTCFEAFVAPAQSEVYYEFNFSPDLSWNIYKFDSYRTPQPPQESNEFELLNLKWNNNQLEAIVRNNSIYRKFEVGLCSVIKLKTNQNLYYALKHSTEKPDFHLKNNFILNRSY